MPVTPPCPLCHSTNTRFFFKDSRRDYLRCQICQLVFVPPRFFVSTAEEKAEYDLHENSAEDPGYRKFLSRISQPLLEKLPTSGLHGLDFGSGPGPTLSVILKEAGHNVALYDPFYAPDLHVFDRQYDFITTTEVVEHLHRPADELDRLWGCLRPGGILAIMTKRVQNADAFADWHYKNDITHVCFFAESTFEWLKSAWGAELEVIGKDVVMFTKSSSEFD